MRLGPHLGGVLRARNHIQLGGKVDVEIKSLFMGGLVYLAEDN